MLCSLRLLGPVAVLIKETEGSALFPVRNQVSTGFQLHAHNQGALLDFRNRRDLQATFMLTTGRIGEHTLGPTWEFLHLMSHTQVGQNGPCSLLPRLPSGRNSRQSFSNTGAHSNTDFACTRPIFTSILLVPNRPTELGDMMNVFRTCFPRWVIPLVGVSIILEILRPSVRYHRSLRKTTFCATTFCARVGGKPEPSGLNRMKRIYMEKSAGINTPRTSPNDSYDET